MKNNKTNEEMTRYYGKYLSLLTMLIFSVCCLFFYNSVKVFLAFSTNSFQEPIKMLSMLFSFLLPVICFSFFFYDSYVKPINKIVRIVYSSVVIALVIFNLVGILINLEILKSNNDLGIYESLPSIAYTYPYDTLVSNVIILLLQIYNLIILIKPNHKLAYIKSSFKSYGFFKFKKIEFIGVLVLALIAMFFVGDFFGAIPAIDNIKYDGKFLFLLLLILIIPLMNFIYFLIKPHARTIKRKTKIILYSSALAVNFIFGILMLVFTFIFPNYVALVGKPLFQLDYTISIPISMYAIAILICACSVFHIIYLVKIIKSKEEKNL